MSLGTMEQRTEGMKKQAQELIEQAYNRGFKAGQENALAVDSDKFIEQGRNEAWEASKKIYLSVVHGGLSEEEIREIFSDEEIREIFGVEWKTIKNFSASEAVEKLRAYEEKKREEGEEINVGDEVILNVTSSFDAGTKAIIIADEKTSMFRYNVLTGNGDTDWLDKDDINRKTGRHFPEIVEVLKKMQEDENKVSNG